MVSFVMLLTDGGLFIFGTGKCFCSSCKHEDCCDVSFESDWSVWSCVALIIIEGSWPDPLKPPNADCVSRGD